MQERVGKGIRTVAVLPQPVTEAEQYLAGEGVHTDQVMQVALPAVGVPGTPTLLLVDGSGMVTSAWVGKMRPEQEHEVLSVLRKG